MPDTRSDAPYPLLVNALTGEPQAAIAFDDITSTRPVAQNRPDPSVLGFDPGAIKDPNDLTQTGWGIIFASNANPAIQAQLDPLIKLRQSQVQDPNLFQIFAGTRGVGPGVSASDWARQFNVSLDTQVDPSNGLPYYLLIAGGPGEISFEFQADLKSQWVVGRLYFDNIEDYGRYAQAVVQYEDQSCKPTQARNSALWVTRNPGDLATALLSGVISNNLLPPGVPLGQKKGFLVNAFVNEKATKPQLLEILRGNVPIGPPAVIFTGCHGCDYSGADADTQRRLQGSFLTQEWVPKTPATSANQFTAEDIPADAKLLGTIGFLFACYSGACPALDSYRFNPDGSPIKVAPQPMISQIPQALLSRGMLAAIAHIDLAFPYAFQDVNGTPQMQAIRSPLEQIMDGSRVGYAADSLTAIWNTRAAHLGTLQGTKTPPLPTAQQIGNMTIARDDARNYIVLGDPAAQLRVDDLH